MYNLLLVLLLRASFVCLFFFFLGGIARRWGFRKGKNQGERGDRVGDDVGVAWRFLGPRVGEGSMYVDIPQVRDRYYGEIYLCYYLSWLFVILGFYVLFLWVDL